jgi:outer membrane protein assembly factor BamA
MRWLAIVVFSILPVVAQVKEDPSYEGQLVASVELVSDPRIDLEAYRSKVQQTAGQPFSWEKVRASVSALQESHRFNKVELQVKPAQNGLELTLCWSRHVTWE